MKTFYASAIWLTTLLSLNAEAQTPRDTSFLIGLDSKITELMADGDIPGLSMVIRDGEHSFIRTFGVADKRADKPVTASTLFELGSCSKAFTALAVYRLIHEGKIHPHADVTIYIPWLRLHREGKPVVITIAQLLHHTSGIPWNTISAIPASSDNDALEKTVRMLAGREVSTPSGTTFEYATINYDVLALVIEKITQQPFEVYVSEHVLKPLKLNSTFVGRPRGVEMARGYKNGFFKAREFAAPEFKGNNAAGYIVSNAADMASWLGFQMGFGDSVLSVVARSTHQRDESVPLHGMSSYAAGWEVALDGTGTISHAGVNPNFTAYVAFRPGQKIGVAVMANANSPYTAVIANLVLAELAGVAAKPQADPGDNNDKVFSMISLVLALYILLVTFFTGRIVIHAIRGKRNYQRLTLATAWKYVRTALAIAPFAFGFYILPGALAGFTWDSIFVWTPFSFRVLTWLVAVAVAATFAAYFISLLFPDENTYKRMAPQIILLSVLSGLANVLIIVLVTSSIHARDNIKYLILYYALALSVYLLGRRFVQVNLIRITRGLVYDLRMQLTGKIFSTSYQRFEKIERGRIYTALNDDINTIGESTNTFMLLITSVITAAGAFVFLASIAFWAAMLTIFIIVALAALYYAVALGANKYFIEARDERNVFMSLINGMIDGFKELSLRQSKKLAFQNDVATSADAFKTKLTTADTKFVNAFLVGESLLVILLGAVSFGMTLAFPSIETYAVMSFVIILLYLIGPINGILVSVPSMMQLKVAWTRIQGFINEIPANAASRELSRRRENTIDSIVADNVVFTYDHVEEKHAFEVGPINMEAQKGEIVFIVGGNGSGKTTFAKLLTGLYEAHSGTIRVNSEPVNGQHLSELFSAVFSPPYLFRKLYDIDVSSRAEEISRLLKTLDLSDKVEITEKGYSTLELSNGQRKRLALLQCYLEDSPIYLFDEWAADQDPDYRNFFYRTLLPKMKRQGKIVIAITHDHHYLDVADKVFTMKEGRLEPSKIDVLTPKVW
ncbi:MAG: cyclic peptide export ABC transporter [Cyclobacteriaceae bacterium]|jgi:putative ATP-binding cassette transporter